jgi:hypothetical protein
MRKIKAMVAVAFVLASACGETATAQYHTTGAQCLSNHTECRFHSECCSHWCVNGDCEQRQP